LYFDSNHNYFGFDGCRYFNGRYESKDKRQLVLKSIKVKAKNTENCGNLIVSNLVFVDEFSQANNGISLASQGKKIMTLTPKTDFDARSFLPNATFKSHTAKSSTAKSHAPKAHAKSKNKK